MKNQTLKIITIAVVAILGLGAYTLSMVKSDTGQMKKIDGPKMEDVNTNSRYVTYSKEVYDSTVNKRRILYFYASWCPTCKVADGDFTNNPNNIPVDVVVIRVSYNDADTNQEEKDLAAKHGITYQHTFVQIDSSENQITKWNGGKIAELLTNIK